MCLERNEDRLVISSNNDGEDLFIVLLAIEIFMVIRMFIRSGSLGWAFLALGIIVTASLLKCYINYFRRLIFTKEGCTIKVLWFKKTYKWSEIVHRSFEEFTFITKSRYGKRKKTYTMEGYFFSTKKLGVLSKEQLNRRKFRSPFRDFFVIVIPNLDETKFNKQNNKEFRDYYAVDREVFLDYMRKWNVDILGVERMPNMQ